MTDINDLVQEFWTSSNGAVLRSSCLLGILQKCLNVMVCLDSIISIFATVDLADNNL